MTTPARDHDQWTDSLGAWMLGALPDDEAAGFKRHLAECAVCREDAATLQVAADALPASVEPRTPPPALKSRIMAVVESEAELLHAAGPESDRPQRRSTDRRRGFSRLFARPALAWGLAALLLVVGAGIGLIGRSALDSGARTVTAQVQSGARASLEIDGGHGRLVASRLPAPPDGRVYQVWLDKGGPTPEPTNALFSTRTDGSASVDVPGSLDGVKRVMVTDEPPGGSSTPTGKVLITASTA
jgi:anti-sigma-K factor RskA